MSALSTNVTLFVPEAVLLRSPIRPVMVKFDAPDVVKTLLSATVSAVTIKVRLLAVPTTLVLAVLARINVA